MTFNKFLALFICASLFCGCEKNDVTDTDINDDSSFDISINTTDGKDFLETSFWTEEHELKITSSTDWELTLVENNWVEFWNQKTNAWENISKLNGNGNMTVKIRTRANDSFEAKNININISNKDNSGILKITQQASPDMLTLLEDENLRMAASVSVSIYGIDGDEDGKVSAYEAEIVPEDNVPYGIDAGQYDVKSIKGIENFPHIRHLDLNNNTNLEEFVITKNTDLMSIHLQGCSNLKTVEISSCEKLIELGADFSWFIKLKPFIDSLKGQMHTLGILNRKEGEVSVLDFSGYSKLNRLYINDNHLTQVNLTGCNSLQKFIAIGNDFETIDISETDRNIDNQFTFDNCPNLRTIFVWKGWDISRYNIFSYDKDKVQIIEKEN